MESTVADDMNDKSINNDDISHDNVKSHDIYNYGDEGVLIRIVNHSSKIKYQDLLINS